MPYKSYLYLAHSISSSQMLMLQKHQTPSSLLIIIWVNTWLDLFWKIWSTPYHHMTSLVHRSWPCSLFTVTSVHRCQVLPKLHRLVVHRFKVLTCPSPLQPVHQAKPYLDLLHFVTWLHAMSHMQWVPPSHYMSIALTLSHISSMAHVAHTSIFVWTNYLCIST